MTSNKLSTLCYIGEQTSFQEDYNEFGYKIHDFGNRMYVVFEGILQSFGVLNRNGRLYDAQNIMQCIQTDPYITAMLAHNSWMGELEHPAVACENETLSLSRLANVWPDHTSHFIRAPHLDGNLLKATIQTDSSNNAGMNMAIKIVDGKVIPGFSARVLGELKTRNGQPYVNVKRLITYDYVLFPSHKEAVGMVNKPYTESIKPVRGAKEIEKEFGAKIIYFDELAKDIAQNEKEAQIICEAFNLTTDDIIGVTSTGNSVVLKENQNVYVVPVTNSRARSKSKKILNDWLNS